MTDNATGYGAHTASAPDEDERSLGELLSAVTTDITTLMRQEVDLAKAEVRQEVSKAGKGAGMLAGAGVAGHLVLVFLSLCIMFALGNVMDLAWAALIVAAVWGIAAATLGLIGKKQLAEVNPKPERTVETLKEDVQWAQNRSS